MCILNAISVYAKYDTIFVKIIQFTKFVIKRATLFLTPCVFTISLNSLYYLVPLYKAHVSNPKDVTQKKAFWSITFIFHPLPLLPLPQYTAKWDVAGQRRDCQICDLRPLTLTHGHFQPRTAEIHSKTLHQMSTVNIKANNNTLH
jgi:hypothetical protein